MKITQFCNNFKNWILWYEGVIAKATKIRNTNKKNYQ